MAKRVAFTDQAKTDIRSIPQSIAIQILRTLARFLETEEGDVKHLQGVDPPLYRLRAQNHRINFRDHGSYIEIVRVRDRKESYR
jgi:mRNA-degrading endonuclease RelE of RelBE toxin-antitoxin system